MGIPGNAVLVEKKFGAALFGILNAISTCET
jgi:hypothetical protein